MNSYDTLMYLFTIMCSLSTLNNIRYLPWTIIAIPFNETFCNLFDGTYVVSM